MQLELLGLLPQIVPVIRSFSDRPTMGRGLNDLRAEITFPLSKTSILEIKHHQWLIDAVRKKSRRRGLNPKNYTDWIIGKADADDAFVDSFNRKMAKQAHLLVFSGIALDWLTEWMQEPLKAEKQAVNVLDTEEELSVLGRKSHD